MPVAWTGGKVVRSTGNSFAAPHIAGICALILSKHPWLTPFQLKTVLYLAADNTADITSRRTESPMSTEDFDSTERKLLQSIVEVARHMFGAAAASIFLVDPETGELVFEAVSGEGEKELVGSRFPAGPASRGWVATSGQPMVADDLRETKFDHDAAESTGYVPATIMAAPLDPVRGVRGRAGGARPGRVAQRPRRHRAARHVRHPGGLRPGFLPGCGRARHRPAIDPRTCCGGLSDRPPNGDGPRDVAALKLLALAGLAY